MVYNGNASQVKLLFRSMSLIQVQTLQKHKKRRLKVQ